MPIRVSPKIREKVAERAKNRCEYCLLPETDAHHKHQVDHIFPRKHGGKTVLANLAFACWRCNLHKGADIGSYDLAFTEVFAPFFNPRQQIWIAHFRFSGALIMPLTTEARVTERIFRFNDAERIEEREALIEAGIY